MSQKNLKKKETKTAKYNPMKTKIYPKFRSLMQWSAGNFTYIYLSIVSMYEL